MSLFMALENRERVGPLVNTAPLEDCWTINLFRRDCTWLGEIPSQLFCLKACSCQYDSHPRKQRDLQGNGSQGLELLLHFPPFHVFPPGSVHLSLFCRHCNLERPGRGEREQDHAGEDLRHPHRGGGLRGLHAVDRELWKWSCCHCLQGDFSSLVSFVKIGMSIVNLQGAPPMVFYDFSLPLVYGMAFLSMAFDKVTSLGGGKFIFGGWEIILPSLTVAPLNDNCCFCLLRIWLLTTMHSFIHCQEAFIHHHAFL